MGKRKVISGAKKQDRDHECSVSSFLFYLCGVYGLLFYIDSFAGIAFDRRILCLFILVFGLLLWFVFSKGNRCFFLFFLVFAVICAAAVYKYRQPLFKQTEHFASVIIGSFDGAGYRGPERSVTGMLVIAAAVIMYVMFIFEFITGNHGLLCLLFLGLLFLAPVAGLPTDGKTLFLMVVYMASFWALHGAGFRKKSLAGPEKSLISRRSGVICGVLAAGIFLVAIPVVSHFSDRLYAGVYEAERLVYRTADRIQKSRGESRADGQVSRANRYKTGKDELTVYLNTAYEGDFTEEAGSEAHKPFSAVYLKGFSGGAYTENGWDPADDGTLLKKHWVNLSIDEKNDPRYEMLEERREKMPEQMEEDYYNLGAFLMASYGGSENYEPFVVTTKFVTDDINSQDRFEPYNHGWQLDRSLEKTTEDGYYMRSDTYDFYDQKYLHIDWNYRMGEQQIGQQTQKEFDWYQESIRATIGSETEYGQPQDSVYAGMSEDEIWNTMYENNRLAADYWNDQLARLKNAQDVYLEAVTAAYTQVPEERLPRLVQLVRSHPLETVEEITAFIIETLQSNASYSLTPGLSALNEDVVESFLFEKGRGYCVHFASAATLMYRLYGIPARYASGYVLFPEDLEKTDWGGQYKAVLTDDSAHAWVEIFLDGKGWTPVEVTPGNEHDYESGSTVFSQEQLANALKNMDIPKTNERAKPAPEQTPRPAVSAQSGELTDPKPSEGRFRLSKELIFRILLSVCVLAGIFALLLVVGFCRRFRLRSMKKWDCRRVYGKMMRMLHFCGVFREWDGSEEEFPHLLSQYASFLPEEAVGRMFWIVGKAAYGPGKTTEEENAFVRDLYFQIADKAYKGLGPVRKLVFRYGRAFG